MKSRLGRVDSVRVSAFYGETKTFLTHCFHNDMSTRIASIMKLQIDFFCVSLNIKCADQEISKLRTCFLRSIYNNKDLNILAINRNIEYLLARRTFPTRFWAILSISVDDVFFDKLVDFIFAIATK